MQYINLIAIILPVVITLWRQDKSLSKIWIGCYHWWHIPRGHENFYYSLTLHNEAFWGDQNVPHHMVCKLFEIAGNGDWLWVFNDNKGVGLLKWGFVLVGMGLHALNFPLALREKTISPSCQLSKIQGLGQRGKWEGWYLKLSEIGLLYFHSYVCLICLSKDPRITIEFFLKRNTYIFAFSQVILYTVILACGAIIMPCL